MSVEIPSVNGGGTDCGTRRVQFMFNRGYQYSELRLQLKSEDIGSLPGVLDEVRLEVGATNVFTAHSIQLMHMLEAYGRTPICEDGDTFWVPLPMLNQFRGLFGTGVHNISLQVTVNFTPNRGSVSLFALQEEMQYPPPEYVAILQNHGLEPVPETSVRHIQLGFVHRTTAIIFAFVHDDGSVIDISDPLFDLVRLRYTCDGQDVEHTVDHWKAYTGFQSYYIIHLRSSGSVVSHEYSLDTGVDLGACDNVCLDLFNVRTPTNISIAAYSFINLFETEGFLLYREDWPPIKC